MYFTNFGKFEQLKIHFLITIWKFRYYSFKNLLRGVRSRCANHSSHLEVLQTIPALLGVLTFFALVFCTLLSVSFREGRITNPAPHCSVEVWSGAVWSGMKQCGVICRLQIFLFPRCINHLTFTQLEGNPAVIKQGFVFMIAEKWKCT